MMIPTPDTVYDTVTTEGDPAVIEAFYAANPDLGIEDFIDGELAKFVAGEEYDKENLALAAEALMFSALSEDLNEELAKRAMSIPHGYGFGRDAEAGIITIELRGTGDYSWLPPLTRSFQKPS
jgi:hypothetical protein